MQKDKVIVIFKMEKRKQSFDIEVPLDISANELIVALDSAYGLGIDVSDIKNCYLQAENPIALLKGEKKLENFGIRNGSIIYFRK